MFPPLYTTGDNQIPIPLHEYVLVNTVASTCLLTEYWSKYFSVIGFNLHTVLGGLCSISQVSKLENKGVKQSV